MRERLKVQLIFRTSSHRPTATGIDAIHYLTSARVLNNAILGSNNGEILPSRGKSRHSKRAKIF